MILGIIVACEVGFWVAVVAGLVTRYVLRQRRVSLALLAAAPVIDLILLAATAIHLRSGATADWQHTLAAFYIGFSVAFGHRLIRWADERFAHRFASGPEPTRHTGAAYTRQTWIEVGLTVVMCAIALGLIEALIWVAPSREQAEGLLQGYGWAVILLGVNVVWAVSYTLWPKKAPQRT